MPRTLLEGVNDVLIRLSKLDATNPLTSFTADEALRIQNDVFKIIDFWNQAIQVAYMMGLQPVQNGANAGQYLRGSGENSFPLQRKSTTIPLVIGQREYDLPSDCERVIYPLMELDQGYKIGLYPGGYEALRQIQNIPSQNKGAPQWAAINPTTGKLRLNNEPDDTAVPRTYTLEYERTLSLESETDEFPFQENAYRAFIPIIIGLYRLENNNRPIDQVFAPEFAQVCKHLRRQRLPQ